jgi:hypothetical protein
VRPGLSATSPPFLINCGDDPEGEMLTHWLGRVSAPNTGRPEGTLTSFCQNRCAPGGSAQGGHFRTQRTSTVISRWRAASPRAAVTPYSVRSMRVVARAVNEPADGA